jgi:hypothetical protein
MSDPAAYGETWASIYDEVHTHLDPTAAVEVLAFPVEIRYVWPSELDLMAQLAGLRLRDCWADWQRGTYTGTGAHVSIYERE